MNKRVELLTAVGRTAKKLKLPKQVITVVLVIVLMFLYILDFIITLPKRVMYFLFQSRKLVLNYVGCIMLVMIVVTLVIKANGFDEVTYGDEAGYYNSDDTVHDIPLHTDGQISNTAGELQEGGHSSGELQENGYSTGEWEENNIPLPEGVASAGELWYQNVATSGELVDGNLTVEQISRMRFYIRVNRLRNCITIYVPDENGEFTIPVKAMRCSTGGENTPLGIYKTSQKYEFRKLLFNVYGQYATRIVGQILFHSSSYEAPEKDTLIAEEFNKLGEPVSHGCIRLTVEDAKWIYEYCRLGTVVEIYEDENPGPLGIPEVIKLPEDTVWDPTDPAAENPWRDKKPEILGPDEVYVVQGHEADLREKVTATDTCGNDITDRIKIAGSVNCNMTGTYEITYKVTDLLGRFAEKTITYIVR